MPTVMIAAVSAGAIVIVGTCVLLAVFKRKATPGTHEKSAQRAAQQREDEGRKAALLLLDTRDPTIEIRKMSGPDMTAAIEGLELEVESLRDYPDRKAERILTALEGQLRRRWGHCRDPQILEERIAQLKEKASR